MQTYWNINTNLLYVNIKIASASKIVCMRTENKTKTAPPQKKKKKKKKKKETANKQQQNTNQQQQQQ